MRGRMGLEDIRSRVQRVAIVIGMVVLTALSVPDLFPISRHAAGTEKGAGSPPTSPAE